MTVQERFAGALTRVATATSIRRTRVEDDSRYGLHGQPGVIAGRLRVMATELEKTAQRLEAGV